MVKTKHETLCTFRKCLNLWQRMNNETWITNIQLISTFNRWRWALHQCFSKTIAITFDLFIEIFIGLNKIKLKMKRKFRTEYEILFNVIFLRFDLFPSSLFSQNIRFCFEVKPKSSLYSNRSRGNFSGKCLETQFFLYDERMHFLPHIIFPK